MAFQSDAFQNDVTGPLPGFQVESLLAPVFLSEGHPGYAAIIGGQGSDAFGEGHSAQANDVEGRGGDAFGVEGTRYGGPIIDG
jgi:hypothetical protein